MAERDKYDTNPLDPDYARKTDEVWGATRSSAHTEEVGGATREVGRAPNGLGAGDDEAPTRRMDNAQYSSYPSVFAPPAYQPPTVYQNARQYPASAPARRSPPCSRTVSGIGLPENVTMILPYIPFYVGLVAAIIELLIVPRNEVRTRFHAAQGLALHLAVLGIGFFFTMVRVITGSSFGGTVFSIAAFIFFIISIIRVWKGEEHFIAPLAGATRWINERMTPKK